MMSKAMSRRQVFFSIGGVAAAGVGMTLMPGLAKASPEEVQKAIKEMIGDTTPQEGKVSLDLPEIAENGNTVPVGVSVDSPMTQDSYVKAVHLMADGNPSPEVITFKFTPQSGRAEASTRMRLAQTQNVVAFAEMSDGSVYRAAQPVKVTIGGCGG
ncbi:Sulfur oxidation protein SoxY [Caenispirillum salinarum AK4]|uniref:Sulfur oxidation protein SoxY n=1 Tax=Caenispirillum salinarum AK4 TaxID=1238182 RepID=K9HEN3_9PROT|nr:thiosulfate oxidation carrier protein SoxY [Caenispirillum salinarum]EKV27116.1 Sulfur oxidation protein SoxY [Caenispirillum salinarum AK4]